MYASTLVILSPLQVEKTVFGCVQAFYELYYLFIKDLRIIKNPLTRQALEDCER